MKTFRIAVAAGLAAWLTGSGAIAAPLAYPDTPRRPVSDTYHDVSVGEDYRWLEQTDAPEVKAWIAAQNQLTRSVLDADLRRTALRRELQAMHGSGRAHRRGFTFAGGRLFAMKHEPPRNQDMLVMLDARATLASERVVVDPTRIDPAGKTTIDWYAPSLDGRRVAVSLSKNGSEDGTLHIFDTASGRALPDVVPRVQYPTGGGSAAWAADGQGLFYTRYPQGSERAAEDANFYQQVWFHRLGTPATQDEYVIGREFPRIAEIALAASEDGRHVLADVSNGDGGEHGFWLRAADGRWRRIADFDEGFKSVEFGRDGRLYALGFKGSLRGRIVALRLDDPDAVLASAATLVPESDAVVEGFLATRSRLYVEDLSGGPSRLRVFALDGAPVGTIAAEPIANLHLGVQLAGDTILYGSQSYVRDFAWYRLDSDRAKPVRTSLSQPQAFAVAGGLPGVEAVREFAVSRDGTRVPVTIVRRKGTRLDGSNPVLLTGYGGYGLSMRPWFSHHVAIWLRHGGVFVMANLRGGGEFGEEWHLAGNLTHKQNVFDDFIACAQMLVERGYTRPGRLAIEGGSNGGLLMGAVLTQQPQLFRVVATHVGIYDALRSELTPNGGFNVTEFGSVKDEAQFKALLAYSPMHRVNDGTAYPAILLTTGEHDGRVDPWMSYKMAARLQAANPTGRPVLLRVAADAGHGIGTSLASGIEQDADTLTFLFGQLGMK